MDLNLNARVSHNAIEAYNQQNISSNKLSRFHKKQLVKCAKNFCQIYEEKLTNKSNNCNTKSTTFQIFAQSFDLNRTLNIFKLE